MGCEKKKCILRWFACTADGRSTPSFFLSFSFFFFYFFHNKEKGSVYGEKFQTVSILHG